MKITVYTQHVKDFNVSCSIICFVIDVYCFTVLMFTVYGCKHWSFNAGYFHVCIFVTSPCTRVFVYTVLPDPPKEVQVVQILESNITLRWSPGFTGHSDLQNCTIQVLEPPLTNEVAMSVSYLYSCSSNLVTNLL